MACPTCSETMALVCADPPAFHCGRCGTFAARSVKDADGDFKFVYVPKLVERCRNFRTFMDSQLATGDLGREWRRLGIDESINAKEAVSA